HVRDKFMVAGKLSDDGKLIGDVSGEPNAGRPMTGGNVIFLSLPSVSVELRSSPRRSSESKEIVACSAITWAVDTRVCKRTGQSLAVGCRGAPTHHRRVHPFVSRQLSVPVQRG